MTIKDKKNINYKRLLIKLSGELFSGVVGDDLYSIDIITNAVKHISLMVQNDIQIGIVVGGGNIWRGKNNSLIDIDLIDSDYMGMLSTVMNALILKNMFKKHNIKSKIYSSINMSPIVNDFNLDSILNEIENNNVIIFTCGTGHPFFTTDTAAALRALEIKANLLIKATKVDGVYSQDPNDKDIEINNIKKYSNLSFNNACKNAFNIMDLSALSICKNNKLPLMIFNFLNFDKLYYMLQNDYKNLFTIIS